MVLGEADIPAGAGAGATATEGTSPPGLCNLANSKRHLQQQRFAISGLVRYAPNSSQKLLT